MFRCCLPKRRLTLGESHHLLAPAPEPKFLLLRQILSHSSFKLCIQRESEAYVYQLSQANVQMLCNDMRLRDHPSLMSVINFQEMRRYQLKDFLHSAAVMCELNLDRARDDRKKMILKIYAVAHDPTPAPFSLYAMVTEPIQHNLLHWLNEPRDMATLLAWAKQLAAGLAYIHQQGIVHGSFASENIWVTSPSPGSQPELRIGGFEYAAKAHAVRPFRSYGGVCPRNIHSPLAPESIDGNVIFQASDVFSLGIVLWEIFSGKNAWRTIVGQGNVKDTSAYEQCVSQYLRAIKTENLHMLLPLTFNAPESIKKLIRDCWQTVDEGRLSGIAERPTADQIAQTLSTI